MSEMPPEDFVKNAIAANVDGPGTITEEQEPNRDQPRAKTEDPTTAIDKPDEASILKFPHDLPYYHLSLGFMEYKRPSQFVPMTTTGIKHYIALPVPTGIVDANSLAYDITAPGVIVEAIAGVAQATGDNMANGEGFIDSLISPETITKAGQGMAGAGIAKILNTAKNFVGSDVVGGALQIAGLAENPFATVAFKGPNFKSHSFSWRLSPKNPAESETIRKIAYTLKKMAYPELLTLNSGGFFKYPWIVVPMFNPDRVRPYLYSFKPCVIKNVVINYAPNDRPGFYSGTAAPLEVVLSLELQEIELWRGGDGGNALDGQMPTVTSGDFNADINSVITDLGEI